MKSARSRKHCGIIVARLKDSAAIFLALTQWLWLDLLRTANAFRSFVPLYSGSVWCKSPMNSEVCPRKQQTVLFLSLWTLSTSIVVR